MQAFFKVGLFLTTYVCLYVKIATESSVEIKTSKKKKKKVRHNVPSKHTRLNVYESFIMHIVPNN